MNLHEDTHIPINVSNLRGIGQYAAANGNVFFHGLFSGGHGHVPP